MKNRTLPIYIAISVSVVATLVLALGAFTGGLLLAPYLSDNAQAAPALQSAGKVQVAADGTDIVAAFEQALVGVYQDTLPSIVSIQVNKAFDHPLPEGQKNFDGPEDFFAQGQGSGFVWDKEGHIVTNYHVIEGATKVEVVFANDEVVMAEVVGQDPDSDLAVIKVDMPASKLYPITVGDSDNLLVGQLAIAIGSPFGQESTMTSGIVSAIGRTIQSGNTPFSIPEVIQTDAPINPGNSGGPLLDRYGQVIGINTQIISRGGGSSGIGFAVPINIAKQVVPALIKGEAYEYAWLGISGRTLQPEISERMNIPTDTKGALVIAVAKDGPAAKAGLHGADEIAAKANEEVEFGGDIITAINKQPVKNMDDLITYLVAETRPGDDIELAVIRVDGKRDTVTVTLGKRPGAEALSQDNK